MEDERGHGTPAWVCTLLILMAGSGKPDAVRGTLPSRVSRHGVSSRRVLAKGLIKSTRETRTETNGENPAALVSCRCSGLSTI
jgi:hypothetical protein